ncbi:peptidase M14, partial [Candidatus Sumerlaeota bacterium]|nr:peptidase M14 [Candidatus Sumerlaeota bacterium]
LRSIAEKGEKILPFYRALVTWKDLYTVWGGEKDWFYAAGGITGFTNELWTNKNLFRTPENPTDEDRAFFMEHVLLNDGVVEWKEFDHPTYGKIEIGGEKKEWGRIPPSFLLEEECHRNMAFTLYHADMMPLLKISEVKIEKLADGLCKIWVAIENSRLIPTRLAQDVASRISPPDIVSLAGPRVKVLSSGRVIDRFFGRVEAVKRRPERVELDTIEGMSAERVQFIVKGSGSFTLTVDSAKGGLLKAEHTLPN